MNFKSYSRLNTIVGWAVFAIAAFTYLSTIEWTVSLWDCGEFIPSAYKLEVSHPPGAPLHGIINHLFTLLSFGNVKLVPILVNSSAALASAFTILFLFWSITALALKLLVKNKDGEIETGTVWAILGAGAVGGLAYTFSDTFWFSAVEGEVYALSSFFTALIFWVALKWEARADESRHLRWFALMFYLIGLVIGIHLLGLLVIPVMVLMYYYKKYKVTRWGVIIALLAGFAALGVVQLVVIQYLLKIAGWFDLFFVNSMGMPFWSGVIVFFMLFLFLNIMLIYLSQKDTEDRKSTLFQKISVYLPIGIILYSSIVSAGFSFDFLIIAMVMGAYAAAFYFIMNGNKSTRILINLSLISIVSVVVGYSSYTMTVIRSYANPPIDMNYPQDVFNLQDYLSRAQYGDSYVLYGPYFNGDRTATVEDGDMQYYKNEKKHEYSEDGYRKRQKFTDEYCTFFPRMYSDNHKQGYRGWLNLKQVQDPETGKQVWEDELPNYHFSFVKQNLRFFLDYQMNYMYFRYFAWNFIGRQNDLQGTHGEFHQGNWITGIPPIDKALGRGPQDHIPTYLKVNRAHNVMFALPFILGLLGMYYQYKRNKLDFAVVFLFFFMTGLAIEIYLNMPNPQPRERDYAFVGSFYVYAIWIGLGVLYIWEQLRKRMANTSAASVATIVCLAAVPLLMAFQEWDDHDRSNRYTSLDYGSDYLFSCMPHSILLCNGDNDTYPLWYAQEVEGIRDDVRIVNLSLLSTDWYINELRMPINHAPGLPVSITPEKLRGWEYAVYVKDAVGQYDQTVPVDVREVIKYLTSSASRNQGVDNGQIPLLPTRKLKVMVDRDKVLKNGIVNPKYADLVSDHIEFDLNKTTYMKSDIVVLDMIATANWDIPIYFSITSGASEYQNLGKYLQQEGLAYRLVPYAVKGFGENRNIRVELDTMYKNMMTKFKWGGLEKGNHLVDYVTSRTCYTMRGMFYTLCENLLNAGRKEDAIKAADKCLYVLPENNIPFDASVGNLVQIYNEAGAIDKAKKLSEHLSDLLIEEINYYARATPTQWQNDVGEELNNGLRMLQLLQEEADKQNEKDLSMKIKTAMDGYKTTFGLGQGPQ